MPASGLSHGPVTSLRLVPLTLRFPHFACIHYRRYHLPSCSSLYPLSGSWQSVPVSPSQCSESAPRSSARRRRWRRRVPGLQRTQRAHLALIWRFLGRRLLRPLSFQSPLRTPAPNQRTSTRATRGLICASPALWRSGVPSSTHRSAPLPQPATPWNALTRTDRCMPICQSWHAPLSSSNRVSDKSETGVCAPSAELRSLRVSRARSTFARLTSPCAERFQCGTWDSVLQVPAYPGFILALLFSTQHTWGTCARRAR